jgi:hypothetical protein
MLVRLLKTHTLVDEGLCCRKHIATLHISVERPSADNISDGVAWVRLGAIVTSSMTKRILTLLRKWIDRDDAFVGLRFEDAFEPIDTRQLNARSLAR